MKGIKKTIVLLMTIATTVCVPFALFGCGGEHTHSFVDYVYNDDATCGKDGTETAKCEFCDETDTRKSSEHPATGEHTFVTYSYNNDATCGKDGTETAKCEDCDKKDTHTSSEHLATGEHVLSGDKCGNCGRSVTKGLKYSKIYQGSKIVEYRVSGIGEATDTDIIIPATYEGKPVKGISGISGDGITSIAIPNSVTSVSSNAFFGCGSLTRLTVLSGNSVYHSNGNCVIETATKTLTAGCISSTIPSDGSVTSIGNSAFYGCTGLKSIEIPDLIVSIGNSAFYGCKGLKNIEIPDSVTSIGKSAFNGCTGLKSIEIPSSVTSIGKGAFGGNGNLAALTVASGNSVYHSDGNCIIETASKTLTAGCVTSVIPTDGSIANIGNSAFSGCYGLEELEIPNTVESIGNGAFSDCVDLTRITIPSSVNSIEEYAFIYCYCATIYCESENKPRGWDLNWQTLYPRGIPIPAVWNCKSNDIAEDGYIYDVADNGVRYKLKNGEATVARQPRNLSGDISIPSVFVYEGDNYGVTGIAENAFAACTLLTSIELSNSITSIGNEVFYGCTGLTRVTIPSSVETIGSNLFEGCDSLTVYCEAAEEQSGWTDWNAAGRPVVWDYKNN